MTAEQAVALAVAALAGGFAKSVFTTVVNALSAPGKRKRSEVAEMAKRLDLADADKIRIAQEATDRMDQYRRECDERVAAADQKRREAEAREARHAKRERQALEHASMVRRRAYDAGVLDIPPMELSD